MISVSMKFLSRLRHINRVPLHSPSSGAIFLNSMIGQPNFNVILCGGKPLGEIQKLVVEKFVIVIYYIVPRCASSPGNF